MIREPQSSLATLLFTDIVGSTEKAAELGNRRWRELLERHNTLVRREIRRFGGREVNTSGDGFLITFDRPAQAIRCACAIRDGVRELGLEIRGGVHMGEVETIGNNVGGIAVHTGSRVQAQAGAGDVLVSSTVRDLVEGLGFGFEDRGPHTLKGVPGNWRLFAVTALPEDEGVLRGRRLAGIPLSRRAVLAGAFTLTLALAVGAVVLFRSLQDRGGGPGREAAPAGSSPGLAVMPFTIAGPGLELWREGMVTLLSTNLDGAAGLRAIDPRAVLSRWEREIGPGKEASDRQAALQVARSLGSKYALMGSMVGSLRMVRVTAELYDVPTGAPRGTKQVEGPPDSLLALVDRLSLEVLRANPAGEASKLGELDPRRITTASLPAVRAYLEGEQLFRRARFKEAAAAYTRALEADSTFAFAYYRLAVGCGWETVGCDLTVDYTAQALRYADRLPKRDALLFKAWTEWPPPGETMERFIALYPDDVEGWYVLGDKSYHPQLPGWQYVPPERAVQAFRRAVELDPGFGPAYEHLIPDAFARDDTVEARQLIAGLRQIDSTSAWPKGLSLAYTLTFGDSAARMQATAALDTASSDVLLNSSFSGFPNCCASSPGHWEPDLRVARELTEERHPLEARQHAYFMLTTTYASRGRLREAREAYAAMPGDSPTFWEIVVALEQLGGEGDLALVREAIEKAARGPGVVSIQTPILLGLLAAEERRWEDLESVARERESSARVAESSRDSLELAAQAKALRGYAAAMRSERKADREAGIRSLEQALNTISGLPPYLLRYKLGKLWLDHGDLRQAERHFKSLEMREPRSFNTPIEFYLGRTAEGLGNLKEARLHYSRFVSWWEDCDPELRPMWDEGRRALERLGSLEKL